MRFIVLLIFLPVLLKAQVKPLPNAHAHNDYEHERPLFDALDNGFTSVEADIHLIDGEIYVYHDRPEKVDPSRTLENLYLEPLKQLVKKNKGSVYQGYPESFLLMIDVKSEAEATYQVLKEKLKSYQKMLSHSRGSKLKSRGVTIFLSGNRPIETVFKEKKRWVGIDGRPSDLGKGYPAAFMPVISNHYSRHLKWRGIDDQIPAEELKHLKKLVKDTHAEGKKLRLWASPEREVVWQRLREEGVDLINTDKLEGLKNFLHKKQ